MRERIYVYPADTWACGHYRLIWPAVLGGPSLRDYDVQVIEQGTRDFRAHLDRDGNVTSVNMGDDGCAAVIFQRPTHKLLAQSVSVLRRQGVTVIVDMDDDLKTIHPGNVAHHIMHPKTGDPAHSWVHAHQACQDASLVTVSTPALLNRYAARGNGVVLPNHVPASYLDIEHTDNEDITWCGSLHSHPDDLPVVRGAIAHLIQDGYTYRTIGSGEGIARALGTREAPPSTGPVPLDRWPHEMAKSGVTIAPLSDTVFNQAKSWLKALEAMAVGVPVVMSPRAEYRRLHDASGVGFLAEKPKQWEGILRKLLREPNLRADQSAAGRAFARDTLTLEANAWRWAEAWSDAIARERAATIRT